jgi:hypothetical protein
MIVFESMKEVVEHLVSKYPKNRGKSLVSWHVSELSLLVAVYENDGEDLVHGFIIFKDPLKDYKWVIIDSLHADLTVRNYVEYITEFQEAIALHTILETYEEYEEEQEEVIEEDEIAFYEDLD